LHVNAQAPAVQAAVPLATAGHAPLQPPQWLTLVFVSTHSFPQSVGASPEQPVVHSKAAPCGVQYGAVGLQEVVHAPQVFAFERSVSQPSPGSPLQSA
jgi:hypothetical protein